MSVTLLILLFKGGAQCNHGAPALISLFYELAAMFSFFHSTLIIYRNVSPYICESMNNSQPELDRLDHRILQLLQVDAGLSNLELAERVGLSPTPCARRVKRLITEGVITRQVAMVDPKKLGLNLTAHISVTMDRHTPDRFSLFEQRVSELPEVVDCCVVTGQSADYLLKAVVRDMDHYEQFLLGKLTRIEGVTGVHSSFELRRVVTRTAVSAPEVSR
jgi:Lrp/AsnC family leucine-responsive transcriptional regulator